MGEIRRYIGVIGIILFYCAIDVAVNYIDNRYFNVNVVLYSAILDGAVSVVAAAFSMILFRRILRFSRLENVLLLLVCALCGYIYAISVPTIIDRSLSFYLVEKLQQRGGGLPVDQFKSVFTDEYLPEMNVINLRITEQMESGTVVMEGGCVLLTPKGRLIASLSHFYRVHFLPKNRLILGRYTDGLTDPLKDSKAVAGNACARDR